MRAVLTYHSVDPSGSAVSVPEDAFRAHVDFLRSGRVRVLPLLEILAAPDHVDAVAITFDDALESFGRIAAPLLLDAGLPVTVFVVPDRVGRDSAWTDAPAGPTVPTFPILGWDDLRALARRGVSLGAHTLSHPDLTRLDQEERRRQMQGSATRIQEETGVRPRAFAYPYGLHDEACLGAAREIFDLAVTTELGVLKGQVDPHRVPRLDMYYFRSPGRLAAWGTPGFRSWLAFRRGARRVRRLLTVGGARA